MIDARALHGWLGAKWAFSRWMTNRIEEYGFKEGEDFLPSKVKTGGRPRTDYLLTVDMAKELSMVERTVSRTHNLIMGLALRTHNRIVGRLATTCAP